MKLSLFERPFQVKKNGVFFLAKSYLGLEILLFVILIVHVICIYLPHINYTITITKRYKNVESNGEEA